MSYLRTLPKLSILLVFLPVALALQLSGVSGPWLFVVSGVAILGTVTLIGKATEEIAVYAGALWGGLLNATFGNVTELIIALFALQAGMYEVVRGSIAGSILGNLLLILGGAMVWGGAKFQTQKFSRTGAHVNVGMLWVTVIALAVPSLVELSLQFESNTARPAGPEGSSAAVGASDSAVAANAAEGAASDTLAAGEPEQHRPMSAAETELLVERVSVAAAVILLGLYVLSLIFSLRTHRYLLMPGEDHPDETAEWSKRTAVITLLAATLVVAYLSEAFVSSIEAMRESGVLQISELFIGVIIVAVVGNAAEGMVAIWVARENKMELSFQIAMGSSLQVALMVAPVLVLASMFLGPRLLTLAFNPFELMALAAAVLISAAALNDGETNWIEGAMFLAVYLFFALVFWFHP